MNATATSILDPDACWAVVRAKGSTEDSRFFFGVVTTGVYCRPGCPARTPRRENVRFYTTPAEAEADGLRPCRRCRPASAEADTAGSRIRQICGYIRSKAGTGDALTLDDLGRFAGISPFHLQRTFKAVVGVTPKQFVEQCRVEAFKAALRESGSVTAAVYDAGFSSSSRAYEKSDAYLGMTPRAYRAGAPGISISYATLETPLGLLMMGATDRGLCFLQFGESAAELLASLRAEYPSAAIEQAPAPRSPQFQLWIDSISGYLKGERLSLDLPLDIQATAFQIKIWTYLQSIPRGATASYSQIAEATGSRKAARAVASACAANPVAIVIPCHRVIRGDGGLGGYRWGLERKRALLQSETVSPSSYKSSST